MAGWEQVTPSPFLKYERGAMKRVRFKKLHPDAIIPEYQTSGASGFDICCCENHQIGPGATKLIMTGLAVELPEGTEMQIRPRSGLALKTPYLIKNSPGTIDADYRGEIGVIVHNLSSDSALFYNVGERIAQGVISPVIVCCIEEILHLSETDRGAGGFGSTGIN